MALLSGGGYAQYVAVHKDLLMEMYDGMNFDEAAAITETFCTAYQLMNFVA